MRITRGDVNAFWALAADNLANLIMITALCSTLLHMGPEIVFGRILPGVGTALLVGLAYYAYLAVKLGKEEDRNDVTALPYGISTPVLFVYVFGVMYPVYKKTGSPLSAWQVGMAAAFVGGIIEASGSLIGPWLKRVTPRAAMLGTLGGIAIVWIASVPMAELFEHPVVGFLSAGVIFSGLIARHRLPFGLPAGLAAIILGSIVGFFTGDATWNTSGFGVYMPTIAFSDLLSGLKQIIHDPSIFTIVLPIEVYNFLETMNNVESAHAAGDDYPVGRCQLMDGVGTMVGALLGSPFPTTVYIGHPAYKKLGATWAYALMVALLYFLGNLFGLMTWLNALIPEAAVAPMLVFVGLVILAQAFTASPRSHAPAVAIALLPHISNLIHTKVTGALHYLNIKVDQGVISGLLQKEGIHLQGHTFLAQGAILTGLLWAGMLAAMIDSRFEKAGTFALGATILTGLGILHSSQLSLVPHPRLFTAYAVLTVLLYGLWAARKLSTGGNASEQPQKESPKN